MKLTRRSLCAALAAGSSLAFISATDGFSATATGHDVTVETATEGSYLSIEGEAFSEQPAAEPAEIRVESTVPEATLVELGTENGSFTFDPVAPSFSEPFSVSLSVDATTATDTIRAVAVAEGMHAEVRRTLTVKASSDTTAG